MNINHLKNNFPTIAILTNMMATPFSEGIIFGAKDYATQQQYNILCFSGAEFAKPAKTNMSRDRIFELIDKKAIDGLIIPMGALSRFISIEEQLLFLEQFSHIPVITVASSIPGYLDVGYTPKQGIEELVEHLIGEHHVQRFAFAGPTGTHLSTQHKKQYFESALATHGLSLNPGMYITSDMSTNEPIPLLDELLTKPKIEWPQAIVVSTDSQAISIITILNKKGIKVPEDIIVTGSMGDMDSLFSEPPLTSIIEPTYELGWNAAKKLITLIEGNTITENTVLPTSLAVRESCGCLQSDADLFLLSSLPKTVNSKNIVDLENIQEELEQVISAISPEQQKYVNQDISHTLTIMLFADLKDEMSHQLIAYFTKHLESAIKTDQISLWNKLAQAVHHRLIQSIDRINNKSKAVKIASDLCKIAQRCNIKASHYRSFETEKYLGSIREIGIQLNSEFNLNEIAQNLQDGLNFSDCYISIFEDLGEDKTLMSSVFAMQNKEHLSTSNSPYPSSELMPPNVKAYDQLFALVVMPLSFKEDFIGTCVLDLAVGKGAIYEGLLTLFSSALKNQIHVHRLSEAEKKFSDIAHSASDWLWEIDSKACFKYSSDGVKQVLGYSQEEIIGRPMTDFIAHSATNNIRKLINSMQTQHELEGFETRYQHKNGTERVLLTTGNPIIKYGKTIGYRGAYKDISQLKAQQERIEILAYQDPLTNLPNRVQFNEFLNKTISISKQQQLTFALLFIDLDGFKLVNDSLGHDGGDLLLIEVSKLLKQCLRSGDILARFAGDEFTLILPNIKDQSLIQDTAKRILKTLSAPIIIKEKIVYISASIGIALFPIHGEQSRLLLKRADKAMYLSKRNGKNHFSFYEQGLEDALNRTVMIRQSLHTAIREDDFFLVYQPQIENKTGEISGVEALLRLPEEKYHNITPDEFIPIAEEAGLIEEIGLWVFKTACIQQQQWITSGLNLKCSINVSAKQFRNPNLADNFINIVKERKIDPCMVTLEITENAIFDNQEEAQALLQQLSNHGFNIAIDDFGTGYASLSCLHKIPVNIIKIDRSFINNYANNQENASIVPAIIMMSKGLKLEVVAEGVETREQWKFLKKLDCDVLQGYLFSKPILAKEIPILLNNWNIKQFD
ncbi:EAL domain-containing protein [Psychromonas sp. RZ22]|uniref:EAL domain-containing protein n=1 Tax=Psychromonas algarum TaxID=2555643 RepID=UPI0010681BAC|nr:EAL domain-containing protein [Psychromonas sp. RZ22]TEW55706.1 EAL domain-containing protein [Psychromonas sp. RZ22]